MPFIVDVSRQTTVANTFAVFATTTAWAWRRMWGTKCTHEYITLPCAMPALPFCKVLLFVILIIVIIVDNYNNCVAFSLVFFLLTVHVPCVCVCVLHRIHIMQSHIYVFLSLLFYCQKCICALGDVFLSLAFFCFVLHTYIMDIFQLCWLINVSPWSHTNEQYEFHTSSALQPLINCKDICPPSQYEYLSQC